VIVTVVALHDAVVYEDPARVHFPPNASDSTAEIARNRTIVDGRGKIPVSSHAATDISRDYAAIEGAVAGSGAGSIVR
jgi:hypothetical protein